MALLVLVSFEGRKRFSNGRGGDERMVDTAQSERISQSAFLIRADDVGDPGMHQADGIERHAVERPRHVGQ